MIHILLREMHRITHRASPIKLQNKTAHFLNMRGNLVSVPIKSIIDTEAYIFPVNQEKE